MAGSASACAAFLREQAWRAELAHWTDNAFADALQIGPDSWALRHWDGTDLGTVHGRYALIAALRGIFHKRHDEYAAQERAFAAALDAGLPLFEPGGLIAFAEASRAVDKAARTDDLPPWSVE